MNIALTAHNSKKELMVQFCIAYAPILRQHHLIATGTTARYVEHNAGLTVESLMTGVQGGYEQLFDRVVHNKVDLLLFFRDITGATADDCLVPLLRRCDAYAIPYATNMGTAEILVRSLEQDAFEWRTILNEEFNF